MQTKCCKWYKSTANRCENWTNKVESIHTTYCRAAVELVSSPRNKDLIHEWMQCPPSPLCLQWRTQSPSTSEFITNRFWKLLPSHYNARVCACVWNGEEKNDDWRISHPTEQSYDMWGLKWVCQACVSSFSLFLTVFAWSHKTFTLKTRLTSCTQQPSDDCKRWSQFMAIYLFPTIFCPEWDLRSILDKTISSWLSSLIKTFL